MSKKVILSSLLASAAILGTASSADAATSAIKAESKQITITKDNAKLYKDSTMKESTTVRKGNVYIVDGYRDINGKHVYRLYQKDQYNDMKYKGYLVNTNARDLKAEDAKGQFVAKKEATMWNNFFWNNKREVTNQEKVFFAKYTYTLGNGDKYYSMYYKNADGKDTWAGYTNQVNIKPLQATQESKKFTLTRDYKTWNNLYFKQNKNSYDYTKGINFQAKRYYTLNGNKFYSVYRTDAKGNQQWCGYANGYVLKELTATKVAEDKQQVIVQKPTWNTYKDHYFNKKGTLQAVENKVITMKYVYTYGNGKQYASLYDGDTWLGYANVDAVTSTQSLLDDAVKAAQDAINKAEAILNTAQASTASKAEAEKAIEAAKEALKDPQFSDLDNIKAIPSQIKDAMAGLKETATSVDIERLNEAIKVAEKALGTADPQKAELDKAIAEAKAVLEEAKKQNATTQDVDAAIEKIKNILENIDSTDTSVNKEIEMQLKVAIDLLKDVNKIGADKLENDDNYATVLEGAENTLAALKEGKATDEEAQKAIKSIEDFINGLTLNNAELTNQIAEVKAAGAAVYMTQKQEAEFNKFIQQAEEAVKNTELSNFDKLNTVYESLEEAKAFIASQPNKEDADALIQQLKAVDAIKNLPNQGEDLVNKTGVTLALNDAAKDFVEMKKDSAEKNTATVELTKEKIANDAKALETAISKLALDGDLLNDIVTKAGQYNGPSKKEVTAAFPALQEELKDTNLGNYEDIKTAAEAVYAPMQKDLNTVVEEVKPWNNNQLADDPKVKPEALPQKPAATEKQAREDVAVEGEILTVDQFAKYVGSKADTVADYYTKESYTPFGDNMALANELMQEEKAAQVSAKDLVADFTDTVDVVNELPQEKEALRFDKAKLLAVYNDTEKAKNTWITEQKKIVNGSGKTGTYDAKVTAQASAANKGRWHLGNSFMTGGNTSTPTIDDAKLKATKANADTMWKYIYATMETYYQYITSVEWDDQSHTYKKKETTSSTTDSAQESTQTEK